jgi:hypothetical protein
MTWAVEKPDGTTTFSGVGLELCTGDEAVTLLQGTVTRDC